MLPMFGGAVGGLLYAGLVTAADVRLESPGVRPRESSAIRRMLAFLFLFGGGLLLFLAFVLFWNTRETAQREPTIMTAAELIQMKNPKPAPDWVAYTFAESKPTTITVTRRRLGSGGEVQAQCRLVRVADKWLIATVDTGFEGDRLVGRLLPLDASSQSAIERIRKAEPKLSALLPYEFNAVDGSESDLRSRYVAAGWIAFFGSLGLVLGLYLLCVRRVTQ